MQLQRYGSSGRNGPILVPTMTRHGLRKAPGSLLSEETIADAKYSSHLSTALPAAGSLAEILEQGRSMTTMHHFPVRNVVDSGIRPS